MTVAAKVKSKRVVQKNAVPQSRDAAEQQIYDIGVKRRQLARITADMNDDLAKIKAKFEEQAQPYKDDVDVLVDGVAAWAGVNRDTLTHNGKIKTVALATGEISWRAQPPKVTIRRKDAVIESLEKLGLTRFIRTIRDINKDAMLDDPEVARQVAGVSIGSAGEAFAVLPFEENLA